jgi:uncharacterized protein YgbK (DUF1537 family)
MPILLGCIADDFTGATDLAGVLVQGGMRCIQLIGVPTPGLDVPDVDAVVVALKSRSIPAADAIAQSRAALDWLRAQGTARILFKYCSTFDSTPAGNIGPVSEALLDALGAAQAIVCPAFPSYGRTIWRGHLFVGDALLSESGMERHPLNPMTDANLVRVMQAQSRRKVGLLRAGVIAQGPAAVRDALAALAADGVVHVVTDVTSDQDLRTLGEACADHALITGGSGIALGLPDAYRRRGLLGDVAADALPAVDGLELVLSGSCSAATRAQVAAMRAWAPAFRLDPLQLAQGDALIEAAGSFLAEHLRHGPALVYATDEPDAVAAAQEALGRDRAGGLVERALARLAVDAVGRGVRRLVVAGGETSGAIVQALGVHGLRIGRLIAPGVPATVALAEPPLALALKSGNFGGPEFFREALAAMPGGRG